MTRRDFYASVIIGALVGLLAQPIMLNVVAAYHIRLTYLLRLAVFLGFTLLAPFALFILSIIGEYIPVVYQFGKFAAVGALNTFVDFGVLNLEIVSFGTPAAWPYRIFKSISFLVATTNSFFWNKFWTFEAREPATTEETVKFYGVAFVGFVLDVAVASLVFSAVTRPASLTVNLWANAGALVGVAVSFLWDFLGYKFFVFKKKKMLAA